MTLKAWYYFNPASLWCGIFVERGNVIGSDLFEHDDYIKTYLKENPDLPLSSVIKIVFSYCITPRLVAGMDEFKVYLKTVNFIMFKEVFGQPKRFK